jgi:NAD-dependent dihydropyrimidine dehydrogenase PreA subunit
VIELVNAERCTNCDICVRICPTNVFDAVPESPPVIARQADCQTCFMCELYCPEDALYVAPECDGPVDVSESDVPSRSIWGQYRRDSGWGPWRRDPQWRDQSWRMEDIFGVARAQAAAERPSP